jgi:hypothetical protein
LSIRTPDQQHSEIRQQPFFVTVAATPQAAPRTYGNITRFYDTRGNSIGSATHNTGKEK